jgi:hypothetical protein
VKYIESIITRCIQVDTPHLHLITGVFIEPGQNINVPSLELCVNVLRVGQGLLLDKPTTSIVGHTI